MCSNRQRTVVVTGGSRGIGRAICLALATSDTCICFNYRRQSAAAEETASACRERGARVVARSVDVADPKAVTGFFEQVLAETGRLDVLVCNAGITRDGLLLRMAPAAWDAVIDTNLSGAFHCIKAATRPMVRQRSGRIVVVTSVVGTTGNAGQANYAAAKAGLVGLMKSTARELASRSITVNAVAPGLVETGMTAAMSPVAREAAVAAIPLGRTGRPEEIAAAVRFLASEEAAYITGQVLHVSGGMYM